MLVKLFWRNPYLTQCKAKVMSVDGRKVKLDQTVFFAFSGGQESDEGTIGGLRVISAVKQGDKEAVIDIEYELESLPLFNVGDEVEVKIDSVRRSILRRLHSAIHLVYYLLSEKVGALKVVGSHISSEKGRIDVLSTSSLGDILPEIEKSVNTFIEENHPVITKEDSAKPDLRWWSCGKWTMPCGGTHVRSTQEIGRIVLKRKTKGAGKERIEIFRLERW